MAFCSKLTRRRPKNQPEASPIPSWRIFRDGEIEWSETHRNQLLEEVFPRNTSSPPLNGIKGKILLLGPIKSGKSSFINSVLSVRKDKLVQLAPTGGGINSVTRKLNQFICGNFLVCDTMGFEAKDSAGFNKGDIEHLLKGNISEDYEFKQETKITEDTPGFNKNPAMTDKVHCVIVCMNANEVNNQMQEGYVRKWQDLQKDINFFHNDRYVVLDFIKYANNIVGFVVLTIGLIDDPASKHVSGCIFLKEPMDVHDDLSNTFKSKKVHEVVKKASESFCLQENWIHPVKNFTNETFPEHKQGILLLLALQQALEFAEGFIDRIDSGPRASE